jgi:prepilin-type processing-associated H-X9-DG protein
MGMISTLAAIMLPALAASREAARRNECVNHLRQVGQALQTYHELHRVLPPGLQWEPTEISAYGWAVPLLPLLEERAAYERIDRNRAVGDPANTAARWTSLDMYLCPSDVTEPAFTLFAEDCITGQSTPLVDLPTASYIGVFGTHEPDDVFPLPPGDGAFIDRRSLRFADFQRGLSNTIIVGERTMARVPSTWLGVHARGEDAACRLLGTAATAPNCEPCDECEFGSRHGGGANFLWGDGSVRLISNEIGSAEYQRLAQRSCR